MTRILFFGRNYLVHHLLRLMLYDFRFDASRRGEKTLNFFRDKKSKALLYRIWEGGGGPAM